MRIYLTGCWDETLDIRDRIGDQILARYGRQGLAIQAPGRTIQEYLQQVQTWMRSCRAVLVIIGPGWAHERYANGQRLLDDPYNSVRIEIRTALEQGRLVVPVLVHGATMPRADELPPDIAAFALRQAFSVRSDPWFEDDMRAVYTQINTQLTWAPASLFVLVCAISGVALVVLTVLVFVLLAGLHPASERQALPGLAVIVGSILLICATYLAASIAGVIISIRRRARLWLIAIVLGLLIFASLLVLPTSVGQILGALFVALINVIVLLTFALFGPRRETRGGIRKSAPIPVPQRVPVTTGGPPPHWR